MEGRWTQQEIADWAVKIGLQPKLLAFANAVMLYQPGNKRPIVGIYLEVGNGYPVEISFNPDNRQSWQLRELLQKDFDEIEVDENKKKWPRIGVSVCSSELLDRIATWAKSFILPDTTIAPQPVPVPKPADQVGVPDATTGHSAEKVSDSPPRESQGFKVFSSWQDALLTSRGLQYPDGRALYLYRLTEEEFSELEQLLRNWLEKMLPRFGLASVAGLTGFSPLFVLYAAEWWRRRYDGSGFSWEPILNDLGANPEEWSPGQRSKFVEEGLAAWGLKPRERGALRFLGAVAVQGGLPLRLLASARGGIGHLLSRVLKLSAGTQVTQTDLQAWVESLAAMLPKSYRQAMIFTLLADVAWTILMLKQEAGLTSSAEAIALLDKKVNGWRDRFPLPVDDEHAQGMIEQLIRDAASVRVEKRTAFLPVERILEKDADSNWTLRSNVSLPEVVPTDQLARLFEVSIEELPRTAELSLVVGERRQVVALRRMAGNNAYRVDRKPWECEGEEAISEHVLRMAVPDGRLWSVRAAKGEELDEVLPWVFVEDGDSYHLARQGSGSTSAQEVLVAMPDGWEFESSGESEETLIGMLSTPVRRIFKGRGVMKAYSQDGMTFRLRTGRAGAVEKNYSWSGDRYWLEFYSPSTAFRGTPNLYEVGEDGARRKVDGQLGYSVIGAANHSQALGPVVIRYPATGEVRHRSRMLLLPQSANLKVEAVDALSGSLHFKDWGLANVKVVTPGIKQQVNEVGSNLVLSLSNGSEIAPPDLIELELFWPHTTSSAKLRLPFPAKGVRAFDGNGCELITGTLISVQHLIGTRLIVVGTQNIARVSLELSAVNGRWVRDYRLQTVPDALSLEIRLQDYAGEIQQMLSTDDSPDAHVMLAIKLQGAELFNLKLARYSALLEREGDFIRLDSAGLKLSETTELENLPVMAMRLEHPGDEPIQLAACNSEGVSTGTWFFAPEKREVGSWLVYPGQDALFPFRPTLWPVGGDNDAQDSLSSAIGITGQHDREAAIDVVISEIAQDFSHPAWTAIEQLASQVGHLPLPTLDIWRRFSHSAEGMASMALRFGTLPNGFLERFAQELPFAWEAIPLRIWQDGMMQVKKQCVDLFGDSAGLSIFHPHLEARIEQLRATYGAIAFLLGIAGSKFLPSLAREVVPLKFLGATAEQTLFVGENSLLMKLRRMHAEEEWPSGFNDLLSSVESDSAIPGYLFPSDVGFQSGVINLPLLLAVQAATDQTGNWFKNAASIHLLHSYHAFDPEWFEESYNQTIARCLADELITIECSDERIPFF